MKITRKNLEFFRGTPIARGPLKSTLLMLDPERSEMHHEVDWPDPLARAGLYDDPLRKQQIQS
jgi:hypothetical protein